MSPNLLLPEESGTRVMRRRLLDITGTLLLVGTYLILVITQPMGIVDDLGQGIALATFAAYLAAAVLLLLAVLPDLPVSTRTTDSSGAGFEHHLGPVCGLGDSSALLGFHRHRAGWFLGWPPSRCCHRRAQHADLVAVRPHSIALRSRCRAGWFSCWNRCTFRRTAPSTLCSGGRLGYTVLIGRPSGDKTFEGQGLVYKRIADELPENAVQLVFPSESLGNVELRALRDFATTQLGDIADPRQHWAADA